MEVVVLVIWTNDDALMRQPASIPQSLCVNADLPQRSFVLDRRYDAIKA